MIPWLPKETASRLYERPHEQENVKAAYLLATSHAAGFLGREDGKRPAWFNRAHLMPVSSVTADMQEHLANACHVICLKVRQEVTSEPAMKRPTPGRPRTAWQSGLLCARVLWRALFAAACAKAPLEKHTVPLLFMTVSETLRLAARSLLTKVWNEVQVQFTSRVTRYRNMRSRPTWSVLEALQFEVYGMESGFGICDPATHPPSSNGKKPASSLQDFMEEVLALRFAIDWLSASIQDAQEFMEQTTKRIHKRPPRSVNQMQEDQPPPPAAPRQRQVDSFAMMWTEDAELRGVTTLAMRLFDGLEGPAALQLSATFVGQIVLATWKGVEPMLAHLASMAINRTAESHAQKGALPPPPLLELDEDVSQTRGFFKMAPSYDEAHEETKDMVQNLPRGVLPTVIKVQANFKGYVFRLRHFARAKAVAAYCKVVHWPLFDPNHGQVEDDDDDDMDKKKKRKRTQRVDATKLNEIIQDYQPQVSKYLGGDPRKGKAPTAAELMSSMRSVDPEDRRSWPLPTADHRACADLFALYIYSMYRRKELVQMWKTLCGGYERGMDAYAELLTRNPALRPMLDSISAQLKRGTAVGLDRAFVQKRVEEGSRSRASSEADLFKKPPSVKSDTGKLEETGSPAANAPLTPTSQAAAMQAATQLPDPATLRKNTLGSGLASVPEGAGEGDAKGLTGEYMTNYLKEMDGDDSQFKDIDVSVVPLSTGTSPPRLPPHEFILKEETKALEAKSSRPSSEVGSGQATPTGEKPAKRAKPKLDAPFCIQRCKPIWLPIKAHRFAAYRAKVLQLLPQRVLQQYIDFEKQGQYAACIKLMESATPGSLNVLSPATLVNNKPLLVETVLQLIVGYSGLCLRNQQGPLAVKLITQVIDQMSLSMRDLHPTHRTVLEAYLYDTALSVCYYMPNDFGLSNRAEAFFQQASERYLRLEHNNRYCKCCLRAAAVFHQQGSRAEAEYYTQQALKRLTEAGSSSMLVVCHHNLAVHSIAQNRITDAVAHVKSYVTILRMLPKLGTSWMQLMDNTQWLVLKAQELWPAYAEKLGMAYTMTMNKGPPN